MKQGGIRCGKCGLVWMPPASLQGTLIRCPTCRAEAQVWWFPALNQEARATQAQPVVTEAEAACFFHPTQRAAVSCAQCGCFLCGLCDLEVGGRHLCPTCLESAEKTGAERSLERARVRHDHVVWTVLFGTLALGCGIAAPLTGPFVLGYVAWAWRKPVSLVERSRLRLGLAVPVALAGILWGVFLVYQIVTSD